VGAPVRPNMLNMPKLASAYETCCCTVDTALRCRPNCHNACCMFVVQQLEKARLAAASPRTAADPMADTGHHQAQALSSPRRKARSTPRHLSERHRQRRGHHVATTAQQRASPPSTDDGAGPPPGDVHVRASPPPRGRRREPRSRIPVPAPRSRTCSTTAAETATSTATGVAAARPPRTSDDSQALVHLILHMKFNFQLQ